MFDNIIFRDISIELFLDDNQVYIKVLNTHYDLSTIQELLKRFPRIKTTQFIALKNAIAQATGELILFGELKPLIELSISSDTLKAYALINLTQEEFLQHSKKDLVEMIINECKKLSIIFGININEIVDIMKPNEKFIIATGQLPISGNNAVIKLYEIDDLTPQVFDDGKVNHYELNLINKVNHGDWVGERIEPTDGIPGKTVTGAVIPAMPGQQAKLIYDHKTIIESMNENKTITTLTAKRTGAVVYENNILSICNYLEVDGKVSFETGNIDFDGYVEVKQSVEDNFSVKADYDIQVMGKLGVGGIDTIESRDGNIYIRGGIAGKNKAKIICNGNLYTKFASDCTIECSGSVNIGYYVMNSDIKAKEVVLESLNSKIIGGNIEAMVRVVAGEIGSRAETPTRITITGFDRDSIKDEYDTANSDIASLKDQIVFIHQKLSIFDPATLDAAKLSIYNELETALENCNKKLKSLYEKRKRCTSYLHSKGDGEISASKCMYPQVFINIIGHEEHIRKQLNLQTSYYVIKNELKQS